ncbi:hypothetical protein N7540_009948 [Penicillium herquei]|nr:hypothetical protein N7540_009948 [Penicillium herquei]
MEEATYYLITILTENETFPSVSEMRVFFEHLLRVKDCQWNVESLPFLPFETFHAFLISRNLNTPVLLENLVQESELRDKNHFKSTYTKFQERYSPLEVNALIFLMDEALLNRRDEYGIPEPEPEDKIKMLMSAILWPKNVFPCRGGAAWRALFVEFPSDTLKWDLTWLNKTRTKSILTGKKTLKEKDFQHLDNLWEWFSDDEQGPPVKFVFNMALFEIERDSDVLSEGDALGNEIDNIKTVLRFHNGMGG